jgi:ABC-type lipoprotein release transport system permease subunit
MWLITLAWKNLWRNRSRTLITMAAIFFAVVLSVLAGSLKEGVFDNLVKNVVGYYTGYVQVHKAGYWEEQILDNSFPDDAKQGSKLSSIANISAVAPRLESFALASSDTTTKGCLVVGVDPVEENKVTGLAARLKQGQYLQGDDAEVLVAEGLANRLRLQLHDTIVLIGQGYHGSMAAGKYAIKGLLHFGSPELNNNMLFMTMPQAQSLLAAEGMATTYVLGLHNAGQMPATQQQAQQVLPASFEVMTWEQMLPDIYQHIHADSNNMQYVQYFLYLLVCFGIFGTLLMMMVERRFELGMLLAIGMKKSKLVALLLVESVLTVLCGCIIGMIASIPVVSYLSKHPIRLSGEAAVAYERFGFEPIFPTSLDPAIFLKQGIIVLVAGLVLSLYPVYKIITMDAVKAMKR